MSTSCPPATRHLIDRCCGGDSAAWEELVERYHKRIAGLAYRAAGRLAAAGGERGEVARDLLQEVYLRLVANDFRALRAWRGETEESFASYLASIVHAVACDEIRRRTSQKRATNLVSLDAMLEGDERGPLADRLAGPASQSPEHSFLEGRAADEVSVLLATAEPGPNGTRNALIFQLFHFEGLSAREIAEIPHLHLTVSSVESILRRTRNRLRQLLQSRSGLTG